MTSQFQHLIGAVQMNRDWSMNARYSYAMVDRDNVVDKSKANAVYVNFYLYWPKLMGSY